MNTLKTFRRLWPPTLEELEEIGRQYQHGQSGRIIRKQIEDDEAEDVITSWEATTDME